MLIPIFKPHEKVIYDECQKFKDTYKDGTVIGLYASYRLNNRWVFHLGKSVLKDNKVETIDNCIISIEDDVDWAEVDNKFSEFLGDVKCVINYAEYYVFDNPEYYLEIFDIEVMAMHCQYYFRYRGLDTSNIEYTRAIYEYGEGTEINMYNELVELINNILSGYEAILKQDEERSISEKNA